LHCNTHQEVIEGKERGESETHKKERNFLTYDEAGE
jgi:hypothetical protein